MSKLPGDCVIPPPSFEEGERMQSIDVLVHAGVDRARATRVVEKSADQFKSIMASMKDMDVESDEELLSLAVLISMLHQWSLEAMPWAQFASSLIIAYERTRTINPKHSV